MTDIYRQYEETIKAWSASIAPWRAFVYTLAVCLRTSPLYYEFTRRESWGDDDAFRNAHEQLRDFIEGHSPHSSAISRTIERLDAATPDTNSFSNATLACNAGLVHIHACALLSRYEAEHLYWIAHYCYEIADVAAGSVILPTGGELTQAIEDAIEQHPLLQNELQWQCQARTALERIAIGDIKAGRDFISTSAKQTILRGQFPK